MIRRLLVSSFLSAATAMHAGAQSPILAIRDVTVISATDAAQAVATVIIRGRRIEAIRAVATELPREAQVIDGRGKYLIPGLIDTHIHFGPQADSVWIRETLALELAHGVTGVREASASGRERELVVLRARIDSGELLAPRLSVSGSGTPRNVPRHQATGLADLISRLKAIGVDGIKLRDLTGVQADTVIGAARAAGIPVFGHTYGITDPNWDFTLRAVGKGAQGVMHILGIGPAAKRTQRQLAATGWQLGWLGLYLNWTDASEAEELRLLRAMIDANVWLEPTLTTEAFVLYDEWYRGRPEGRFIRWASYDSARTGYPSFGPGDLALARQGFARMQSFVRRFQEAGGTVIAGTDMLPWPGAGIHEELRLLVAAGLTPLQALRAATRNAATALGWTGTGTIEPGRDADLVLLDADPLADIANTTRIRAVIRGGRVLDRATLDGMLAGIGRR